MGKPHELPLTTTWTERETNPCGQKRNKARSSQVQALQKTSETPVPGSGTKQRKHDHSNHCDGWQDYGFELQPYGKDHG